MKWFLSILAEPAPLAFTLSLFSDDGVSVTWTPAPSADSTVVYVIYYSSDNASGQVSVPALAHNHTLRGLVFGATYNISMAARADFETRIGPKTTQIGEYIVTFQQLLCQVTPVILYNANPMLSPYFRHTKCS